MLDNVTNTTYPYTVTAYRANGEVATEEAASSLERAEEIAAVYRNAGLTAEIRENETYEGK